MTTTAHMGTFPDSSLAPQASRLFQIGAIDVSR